MGLPDFLSLGSEMKMVVFILTFLGLKPYIIIQEMTFLHEGRRYKAPPNAHTNVWVIVEKKSIRKYLGILKQTDICTTEPMLWS